MPDLCKKIRTRYRTFILKLFGAKIKRNSVVHFSCEIQKAKGVEIGNHSTIYKETTIYNSPSGRFVMKDNSHVAPYGYFLIDKNKVEIGSNVAIGPHCSFFCHSNKAESLEGPFTEAYIDEDIIIGNNVFIGAHCVILPGTQIPDNVVIGSSSVVKGKLESGYVYAGSPVKKLKKLS